MRDVTEDARLTFNTPRAKATQKLTHLSRVFRSHRFAT
jgi:hypothetical protein